MIEPALLAQHLEYSLWASLQILEAARQLPAPAAAQDRGNSFGGINSTLAHIFQADRVWFHRFQGDPYFQFNQPGDDFALDSLAHQWPLILNPFAAWARSQAPASLAEPLFWRNLKGEDKREKKYKILLHVVNHATYHRGQVITMIKQAGGAVVSTDLVYYPGM